MKLPNVMTDADVIRAIRRCHLTYNINRFAPKWQDWKRAWVDGGGTIFGPGPYVKLPIKNGEPNGWGGTTHRVYAPARLRRRIAKRWRQA